MQTCRRSLPCISRPPLDCAVQSRTVSLSLPLHRCFYSCESASACRAQAAVASLETEQTAGCCSPARPARPARQATADARDDLYDPLCTRSPSNPHTLLVRHCSHAIVDRLSILCGLEVICRMSCDSVAVVPTISGFTLEIEYAPRGGVGEHDRRREDFASCAPLAAIYSNVVMKG